MAAAPLPHALQIILTHPAAVLQAALRLVVLGLALTYALTAQWLQRLSLDSLDYAVLAVLLLVSLALLLAPAADRLSRRALEFALDHAAPLWALWRFGVPATPLMVCAFCACIAYGYRFGWRFTLYSAAISITSMFALTQLSPQWAAHELWILVLGTSLLAVALCTPILLERLQAAQRALGEQTSDPNETLYDDVTGLASLHLMRERLRNALKQAERHGHSVGVLYFDLDGIAGIGERLGVQVADTVLREIARRIEGNIRGTDLLARMQGNELVLLIERLGSASACERIAESALAQVEAITSVCDIPVAITASIGVNVFRPDPDHVTPRSPASINRLAEQLVNEANAAMQRAKLQGKGRWCMAGIGVAQVDALRANATFGDRAPRAI